VVYIAYAVLALYLFVAIGQKSLDILDVLKSRYVPA